MGRLIALSIAALLVIIAFFNVKGLVKVFVSCLFLLIAMAHYAILVFTASYADILVLPLIVVESSRGHSVFYIDYGQLSALLLVLLWRSEVKSSLKTLLKRDVRGARVGSN